MRYWHGDSHYAAEIHRRYRLSVSTPMGLLNFQHKWETCNTFSLGISMEIAPNLSEDDPLARGKVNSDRAAKLRDFLYSESLPSSIAIGCAIFAFGWHSRGPLRT